MKSRKKQKPLLHPKIESVLKQIILKDLLKGRKDFDKPHTQAVVFWMKHLLTHDPEVVPLALNPKVLITAAYAHDWGYIGLFDQVNSNSFDTIQTRKKLHMKIGSNKIEQLIYSRLAKQFTAQEVLEIAHLVLFHDEIEKLKTESEILLMEADTLGMLDISRIKPGFSKEDNQKFLETGIYGRRLPKFKHKYALELAEKMAKDRADYYVE